MALTAFCPSCQRNVYLEEDNTPVCPVCSTPLIQTVEEGPDGDEDEKSSSRTG